jgi:hypothetical protein
MRMSSQMLKRLPAYFASLAYVSVSVLLSAWSQTASADTDLNGTWKIDHPRATLTPVDGAVPFKPEARKRYEANKRAHIAQHYDYDSVQTLCSTPGLPRLMLTPDRFHIWQRPDWITFQFEWNRLFYQIDMTDRQREPLLVGVNIGVSKGQWHGDTLVVNTDNFTDQTLIDSLVPHSDDMKLTQRFRLLDPNTLEDRLTIEDPQTFTRPWEAIVKYNRQPDAPFPEDICIDRRKAGKLPSPPK